MRRLAPWLAALAMFVASACLIEFGIPFARPGVASPAAVPARAPAAAPDALPGWSALAPRASRWHAGAELVLLERERRDGRVRPARERWTLVCREGAAGEFEVSAAGAPASLCRLPLHPALAFGDTAAGRERLAAATREAVRVPAGRFRCAHTWRLERRGVAPPERVDEWWAPGVPVPVQRWRRPASAAALTPPRRARDLPAGVEWTVLERVRRP